MLEHDEDTLGDNERFVLPYTPKYEFIETEERALEVVGILKEFNILAVDTETTGLDPYTCKLLLLQIATPDVCYILNCGKVDPSVWNPILEDKNILKIVQNAKFDYKMLKVHAKVSMRPMFDTMIAERLLTVGIQYKVSLEYMAAKYFGIELNKEIRKNFVGVYRVQFSKSELLYAANDALLLHEIYNRQIDALQRDNLVTVSLLEFNTVIPVAEMELNGCLIDQAKWRVLLEVAGRRRKKAGEKVKEQLLPVCNQLTIFGDCTINLSSTKQLLIHLNRLGLDLEDTSDETLKGIDHIAVKYLREWRGWEKVCTSYGEKFLNKIHKTTGRLHAQFNQLRAGTGRTSSSNPNLQQVPGYDPEDPNSLNFRSCFVASPGYKLVGADYCLSPETRVFTTDYRWVEIKDIKEGDELVGVDEEWTEGKKYRCLRKSTVEKKTHLEMPCYRIKFTNGKEIVSSSLHRWLSRKSDKGRYEWVETQNLEKDDYIAHYIDPWDVKAVKSGWGAGYLAGILDGEGTISSKKDGTSGSSISFFQVMNPALVETLRICEEMGFNFSGPAIKRGGFEGSNKDVYCYWTSGIQNMLHLIGTVRPPKFLERSTEIWENKMFKCGNKNVFVESVEFVGIQPVVGIQTSTRTFIAEGFISHNSQQEIRILAEMSKDPSLIDAFINNEDIHTRTTCLIYDKKPDEITKTERKKAKTINFTVQYGGSAYTVATRLGISEQEANELVDSYFKAFPNVRNYIRSTGNFAIEHGYSLSVSGRRRYYKVPELSDPDYKVKVGAIRRKACNMPIQASAADVGKQALCNFFYTAEELGYDAKLLMFVHDEIICEVKEEQAEEVAALLEKSMLDAFEAFFKAIPMRVDADVSNYWDH
jgi:DNA polymerase I-like protein with 3'-5' exonuclease and polymerase domains